MSDSVVYTRGSSRVTLRAAIGQNVFAVDSGYDVFEKYEGKDFIIRTSDLRLDGAATTPQSGDRIDHDGNHYEVMAPGGEPAWRYSDRFHRMVRIHAKLIQGVSV